MPDLPALPRGLTARPLQPGDVDAAAALLAEAEREDDTGGSWDAEDLTEWWFNDLADARRDGLAVTDGTALLGFCTAVAPPTWRDAFGVYLEGRVHPAHRRRGLGRALLAWQLARGAELHADRAPAAPGRLTVGVFESQPDLEGLVRRAGLSAVRRYHNMRRPLTDLPAAPEVPGVELVAFHPARDDEVRRAHNAAFTEHHGSSERDEASWRVMFTGQRAFRPDLSVLAVEDGAVVAYVLGYVYEADTRATGVREVEFGQIGTLPHARGRGLATAAIVRALHVAAGRDCGSAGLQVDTGNVTGAPRLYESLGFVPARTLTAWSRLLAPVRPAVPPAAGA